MIQEQLAGMHSGRLWRAETPALELPNTFEQVESNREACRQALAFAEGRVRNLAIYGAPGWGKSHLIGALAELIGHPVVQVREKSPCRLPDAAVLLIDDVDGCRTQQKRCQETRLDLERRVRGRKRTVVVLSGTERTIRSFLPSPRSWKVARVDEPRGAERAAIVRRMCVHEGLELSRLSVELVARLVRGDGHSLQGALSRLRVGADGQAANLHPLRVAGLLHPYLLDRCDCDIRDVILDQVSISEGGNARRHAELAVFAMSELAGLNEVSVADYFGLRPVDVYRIRTAGKKKFSQDPAWVRQIDQVTNLVTSYLCEA